MADLDKLITELQLVSAVTDDANFAMDNGIQSYRATAVQVKSYVLAPGNVGTDPLANGSVTLAKLAAAVAAALVPSGSVLAYAAAVAPTGYLLCDGSAVSRTTYAQLFALLGVTHGQGDGSTTFNLPNYQGRFLRGVANGSTNDPDRALRTAMATGGNTGDNVGSVQSDEFFAHKHGVEITASNISGNTGSSGASGLGSLAGAAQYLSTSPTTVNNNMIRNNGGNETRPKNAYVNFVIKT